MRKILFLFIGLLIIPITVQAQKPNAESASEIFQKIKKLNFLGSVLYLAAHPDDENTKVISYFANGQHARTAYLSLTRGDGGQNLIGPELRERLGVIRTQELLAARRIDGGEQMFTRANDFGYSKHPDETLKIWNEEEVLKDVVWAIRKFRPDVIINRFDHRTPGSTHGHHTSSAILSVKAFDLAAQKDVFPEQLQYVETWQPTRMFYNTSWWFYGSQEAFDKADKTNFLKLDTGIYYPLSGLSNTEISAKSRSQHKSQGFGSPATRGSEGEYLELVKGDFPKDKNNIFEGVNTSWNRIEGGEAIGHILSEVEKNYDFKNPSASINGLVEAYKLIQNLENEQWKRIKSEEIKEIIAASAGLFLEANVDQSHATQGEMLEVKLEAINRSGHEMMLDKVELLPSGVFLNLKKSLANNQKLNSKLNLQIAEDAEFTTPYWLKKEGTLGMYKVEDQLLRGLPETPREYRVVFNIKINGTTIPFARDIVFRTNDPIAGDVYTPFEIIPPVSVGNTENIYIFSNSDPQEVKIHLKAGKANINGNVRLSHPDNWQVSPRQISFQFKEIGEEKTLAFTLTPPENQAEALIKPEVTINGKIYRKEVVVIDYDHIQQQTLLAPSEFKAVRLNIKKRGENVAYIEGAGDVIPQSLEQMDYKVTKLAPNEITKENLAKFDAVVLGIRAYNVVEELKYKQQVLFDFVKNGRNMIVQYNTSHSLKVDQLAPYKLQLSRDRVTDENAEIRFLSPNHQVLNSPNKITKKDFENWVQERGLYFPSEWSEEFTPILSANDINEEAKNGSLLVAKYGKGYYIYTGLSFFRQFPAGVPGAYRLFANLISLE